MPNGVKIYRRKFEGNRVSIEYLRVNLVGYVRLGEVRVLYRSLVDRALSPSRYSLMSLYEFIVRDGVVWGTGGVSRG